MTTFKNSTCAFLLLGTSVTMVGCGTAANQHTKVNHAQVDVAKTPSSLFSETTGVLPASKRARRKWDGPIVSDLDGNGWQDLLLTEHADEVLIFWNEGGQFSAPDTLLTGDMHGTGIADFDNDGLLEVIIAQGGGNGSNPRKPKHIEITKARQLTDNRVLSHFEKGRGRAVKTLDANQDGNVDLFLTGFATPEQAKAGANHLYSNDGTGAFTFEGNLPYSQRLSYKTIVTNINDDNDPDVIIFGGGEMVAAIGGPDFEFKEATQAVLGDTYKTTEISAIAQLDYDNDGDLDLAISRAKHQFSNQLFYDKAQQRYAFFSRFQPLLIDVLSISGNFKLVNLQMAYPDFDIYLGEQKTKLELAGRDDIDSYESDVSGSRELDINQLQALGWPRDICPEGVKMNDLLKGSKPGLYIGYLGGDKWRICSQTRSPTAGVVLNVTDGPAPKAIEPLPVKLLENQNGHYVEVTAAKGIDIQEPTASVVAADFDNDGWTDLLFMKYGNMAKVHKPTLYMNNKGNGFVENKEHGIVINDLGSTGAGADVIDFDKDGDLDLVTANERGTWRLFENHTASQSSHHFMGVIVGGSPSGKATQLGAKATLKACGRQWQQQVGASSSAYADTYNNQLLFGLGKCAQVDSVKVQWTNGESQIYSPNMIDGYFDTTTAR
ncbi:CRTAC1 family protein [Paraglaciecola sp. 20A4]|uniref:CRTAC1 family protein n=1 Tax=Paraglaciecola sp. 20A4 TaxID=2687288 RepID=UPI00140A3D72|nr:CRTAC1 family protein [Paraglaciecola sp. 20A4]